MPGPPRPRETDRARPSGEYVTGGTSKRTPLSFVTRIVPDPDGMGSDSVTETFVGTVGRIVPAPGVELTYWAWAAARPLAKRNPRSPARRGRRILRRVM